MPPAETPAERVLRAALAAGLWTRPFLLLGRGEARDAAAEAFAKAVLCAGRGGDAPDACGSCGPCGRFERGIHADFHRLVPEKGRVTVGVEAVEALQSRLALKPVEGRAAAALVPGAEALSAQAQNALLKTLEEPPPRTALVLTAAAPRALLPTVRSRCATVRLRPLPADAVLAAARRGGAGAEDAAVLVAAAAGDPAGLESAAGEGAAAAAGLLARAFGPAPRGPRGSRGASAFDDAAAWVRGAGGTLEDQRVRLRMGLRILLALHLPARADRMPASLGGEYNALPPGPLRARLAALGEARERVERFVDPVGVLEGLAEAFRAAAGRP